MDSIQAKRRYYRGVNAPDLDKIETALVAIEKHIGSLTNPEREDIEYGCLHVYMSDRKDPDNGPQSLQVPMPMELCDTRKQLTDFIATANDLMQKAEGLRKNRHLCEPLRDTFGFDFGFFEPFDTDDESAIPMVQGGLAEQVDIISEAFEYLPEKGRWPSKPSPEKDLVRYLSKFFEHKTGNNALSGIRKTAGDPDFYTGPFFDLIESVWNALEIVRAGKSNAALGKLILRALKRA